MAINNNPNVRESLLLSRGLGLQIAAYVARMDSKMM